MSEKNKRKLDFIPTIIGSEVCSEKDKIIEDILEQHKDCGYTKFVISYPTAGWFSVGNPPIEVFRDGAEAFKEIKEA